MAWVKNRDNSGGQQKDYLNAADTAGRPMALASILFTLLFIAAIVLLLFSVGRWAYTQMIDEEVTVSTTQQEAAPSNESTSTTEEASTSTEQAPTNDSATATTEPTSDTSSSVAQPTATTPATVPNTGPESVLGLFVISVVIATLVHYRWQLVKNR